MGEINVKLINLFALALALIFDGALSFIYRYRGGC